MSGERGHPMCLDCGCGEPNERHDDDRHIITDDIRAAVASEISVDEAKRNSRGVGPGPAILRMPET